MGEGQTQHLGPLQAALDPHGHEKGQPADQVEDSQARPAAGKASERAQREGRESGTAEKR